MVATYRKGLENTIVAYQPLWVGSEVVDSHLSARLAQLNPIWTAWGGYWSLSLTQTLPQMSVEQWIEEGLGRHIELYDPYLGTIWEGYVSEIAANIGGLTVSLGPLLDIIGNKVKVAFSTVDYSIVPPAVGIRDSTDWAEDADSQDRYGVIEHIRSVSGVSDGVETQIRDLVLEEMRGSVPKEQDNIGSDPAFPSVSLTCLGYAHWLKAYTYSSTVTGLQDADAKVSAILNADSNGIFSTDHTQVDANTTQVGAWENDDSFAWGLIKSITALGDSSNDRWVFGLMQNRQPFYRVVPTDILYSRRLAAPAQGVQMYEGGSGVRPWNVEAGQNLFYTDLLIGRPPDVDPRLDPRQMFVEQSSYTTPWALTLDGSTFGRLDQMLAQLGLAGRYT